MRTPLNLASSGFVIATFLIPTTLPTSALPPGASQSTHDSARTLLLDPDTPVLVSPPDGAKTTGASDPPVGLPTLKWAAVPGATRYHVQLSASAGFATLLIDQDTYALTYSPGAALADGTYYWRVAMRRSDTGPRPCRSSRAHVRPRRSRPPRSDDRCRRQNRAVPARTRAHRQRARGVSAAGGSLRVPSPCLSEIQTHE
jgi:hypothetical protein